MKAKELAELLSATPDLHVYCEDEWGVNEVSGALVVKVVNGAAYNNTGIASLRHFVKEFKVASLEEFNTWPHGAIWGSYDEYVKRSNEMNQGNIDTLGKLEMIPYSLLLNLYS